MTLSSNLTTLSAQVIFVSSSSGAPASVVACPPRTTPLSEPGPLPGPGPGPGATPGVIQGPAGPGPGVIQGPGGALTPGERRPRPPAQLDPNTDTYRQLAGEAAVGYRARAV